MNKPEAGAEQRGAFDIEARLRRATEEIVADMVAAGVAEKIVEVDERVGDEYWMLATPGAFEKRLVVVGVLGYPELAGVWSYTLLGQGRISETSMEPYFRKFAGCDFGFVAVNPNCLTADIEGDSFLYQLGKVMERVGEEQRCGLIGFSMGGGMVLGFLDQQPELLERMAGLVLLDPTLPNRLRLNKVRPLLDKDTLLIASKGQEHSPGELASALLNIPAVSLAGIHGEMPNKALSRVVEFYKERMA